MRFFGLLLIPISLMFLASTNYGENENSKLWDDILPKLRSVLNAKDKQEKLPDSAILKKDKKDSLKEINELLDESVQILGTSETQTYRKQIQSLESENREARVKIAEFEEKRISAPESKPVWKTWETTAGEYSKKIDEKKREISRRDEKIQRIKESIRQELQTLGLNVSVDQLDFLLSTVVGDNAIEVMVAFDNVKALTLQLEKLTAQSEENLEITRRYYGMYTVLLEILDRMYFNIIDDIDRQYLPQIEGGKNKEGKNVQGIIPKTEKLLRETEKLSRQASSERNREVLSANLRAQQLTISAARLYKTYLEKQRADISTAKKRLAPDLAAARNTYETVKVSSELVAMMKSGQNLFDSLKSLQVPELRVFENLEMKKEFEKLTVQLQTAEKS